MPGIAAYGVYLPRLRIPRKLIAGAMGWLSGGKKPGRGERTAEWLSKVLQGRDRREAGPTAPPAGLYFVGADYPAGFGLSSGKLRRPPTGAAL